VVIGDTPGIRARVYYPTPRQEKSGFVRSNQMSVDLHTHDEDYNPTPRQEKSGFVRSNQMSVDLHTHDEDYNPTPRQEKSGFVRSSNRKARGSCLNPSLRGSEAPNTRAIGEVRMSGVLKNPFPIQVIRVWPPGLTSWGLPQQSLVSSFPHQLSTTPEDSSISASPMYVAHHCR